MLVSELSKDKRIRVTVFSIHYPFTKRIYHWNGVKVIPLGMANRPWKKWSIYSQLKLAFHKENKFNKFDLIHSFWLNQTTYVAQKLAKHHNLPLIATAMGQDVLEVNKWLKKIKFAQINSIVTLCDFQDVTLKENIECTTEIIHFGITSPKSFIKSNKIVAVGNLIPLKKFNYCIKLLNELVKIDARLKLRIIGDGPERNTLKALIEEYNLYDSVELLGQLSYEDTLKEIGESQLLIHPSDFEGFGMTLIEGLGMKTRVIASPVGMAFKNPNISNLTFELEVDVKKILLMLNDQDVIEKLYSIEDSVERYLRIYADC